MDTEVVDDNGTVKDIMLNMPEGFVCGMTSAVEDIVQFLRMSLLTLQSGRSLRLLWDLMGNDLSLWSPWEI